MKTQLFTVFLTLGPSNCGKTSFLKNKLSPALKKLSKIPTQIVHLSSDEIRQQILGYEAPKLDPAMALASEPAFDILLTRLKASMSYPISAHFIFVDTTGLNEDFRKQVQDLCHQHQYNCELLIFDYKDTQSYFEGIEDNPTHKRVANQHLTRMRQDVFKSLKKKSYTNATTFKERPKGELEVEISDLADLEKNLLPLGNYTFIGDIHGHLVLLLSLLNKLGVIIENGLITSVPENLGKLILVGDYLDKGKESGACVDFIYANRQFFLIVRGNHEHFVLEELKRPSNLDESFKKVYFNSAYELTPEQQVKLTELYEASFDFLKAPNFICTHSPCLNKYLGKVDKVSKKLQRKTAYDDNKRKATTKEEYIQVLETGLSFLKTEAHRYHPLHVFGHQSFPRVFKELNKVGIDTGAVHGGSLTAMNLTSQGKMFFTSVKGEEIVKFSPWGLVGPFMTKEEVIMELSSFDKERIELLAQEKVSFISGTVSPADKQGDDLESLEEALNYYRPHTEEVELQIKHMGSRSNIYLRENIEDCRAVSRNGFLIKKDLTSVFKTLLEKHLPTMKSRGWKMILLDGELMPWSMLGKGLIDEQYQAIADAVKGEVSELESSGFTELLNQLNAHPKKAEYEKLRKNTSAKKLQTEFGSNLCRSFDGALKLKFNLQEESEAITAYQKQVEIYGKEESPYFLPFALLKAVKEDGSEECFVREDVKTKENYALAGGTQSITISLKDPQALEKAKAFFSQAQKNNQEGIVVKPMFTYTPKVVPFLKVRNPEYLRLIYGYNYTEAQNLKDLVKNKSVSKKRKISTKEYTLGKALLEIPEALISVENPDFVRLISSFIAEEREEQSVDKRL